MALRGTLTHWKTQLLAQELEIDQAFALGLLESLWHVTAQVTPTGCIGRLSNHGIAMRMFTSINPDKLIKALVMSGHLEKSEEHGFIIHDWSEHSDDAVDNRLARHGLYYADGKQPRMRRMSNEERERLCAKFGFSLVKRGNSVRTENHGEPRSTTENHYPEASSQKPVARIQNPVSTEALEKPEALEQRSSATTSSRRLASSVATAADDVAAQAYVKKVSEAFTARTLTPKQMSKADLRLAAQLHRDGVSLERVQHAIWLGCARKLQSLANGNHPDKIASLRYFQNLLNEPELETAPKTYWQHVERTVKRWEKHGQPAS